MSEALENIFSPGGILDERLDSYCFRSSQLEMAELVESAFDQRQNAIIEAGTGTGKSFAYLAPAMLRILEDPRRKIVVATSTITLEKQLYEKDIPFLSDALGFDEEVAVLFGRSNYACIARYRELEEQNPLLGKEGSGGLAALGAWIRKTETGEKGDIADAGAMRNFALVASDEKTCRGPKCPYYLECFYFKARRNAMKARLLVTNHHLFLIDGKHRAECSIPFDEDAILPSYDAVILDEAHHLESEATDVLSDSYSLAGVERVLDFLLAKDSKLSCSILEHMSVYERSKGTTRIAMDEIRRALVDAKQFDERLTILLGATGQDDILFDENAFSRYRSALSGGEAVAAELAELSTRLAGLHVAENIPDEDQLHAQNIARAAESLSYLSDTLRSFIRFGEFDRRIAHAQGMRNADYELTLSPMEVGPILRTVVLDNISSAIFCSATLSLNRSFEFFKGKLGLDKDTLEGVFESPFRYKENLMLLLPRDGIAYRNDMSEEYVEYTASAIKEAILYSGGGALVLFTSRKMLEEVHARVSEMLPDFVLYRQGGGMSRNALLGRFKKEEDSSLFATSSFWEGIDAPGNTLRLVIIVKLPFQVPTTPIYQARCTHLEKEGKFPFLELTVPEAAIRLKQGLGRLIRSENDKGIVIILDSRILQKSYGRLLLSSLPECYCPEDATIDNLGSKIEHFLY